MPIPSQLYKYRQVARFTEDIIVNSRVYFAAPSSFNDPFDCTLPLDFSIRKDEFKNFLGTILPKFGNTPRESAKLLKNGSPAKFKPLFAKWKDTVLKRMSEESSVFCVSECKDDILMYSHYADSHRGCCLEFDFTKDSEMCRAEAVRYESAFPELNYFKLHGPTGSLAQSLILTKAAQWKYEREWRGFRNRVPPGQHKFDPACLTGVIFGAKISPADEQTLRDWVARSCSHPKFYRARMSTTHFKMDITPA